MLMHFLKFLAFELASESTYMTVKIQIPLTSMVVPTCSPSYLAGRLR
jgi:hypothetical protein